MISMRCWILRPDCPAAVPLGKECTMEAMSNFKPRERGVQVDKSGIGGGGQLGCLSLIICHVESLLGTAPSERRVRHAFPYIPSLTSVTVYSMVLFGSESYLLGVAMAFSLARSQRIPNSFLDQRSQLIYLWVLDVYLYAFKREARTWVT